jgi:ABC-type uncharacterized transport system involved in gliding motility auxiliary subunit
MLKRIVGIIGWIGTALVFVALAVRFVHPAWERAWYFMAWAGLVAILVYAVGQWREMTAFLRGRHGRLGTAAVLSTLIVLGILVAVNYLAARENKRWDLTTSKVYTLSEQTQKLVSKLDAPLKMIAFGRQADLDRYRLRMPEYEYVSKKVSVQYVDPDKDPALARQYQVQTYGTIVLLYKTRVERSMSDSEQDLANALIKVITGDQKKVYFVQGHGEHDTTNTERGGYSGVAAALGRDNYSVDKLVLAQQNDVPADASVVVVAGPETDFVQPEIDRLRAYLQRGGKLLLMLDPPEKADSAPLTNLLALARDWDVQVNDDVVLDTSGMGQLFGAGPEVPVAAPPYPAFPITEQFRKLTAFPLVRSVTPISGGVNGRNATTFLQTGPNSYGVEAKRVLLGKQIELNPATDKRGPMSIAAAVSAAVAQATPAAKPDAGNEKPRPETRVAVVGNSTFADNTTLAFQGNKDLFMNTVSWLAQQENLISIRPKEPDDRRLTLTALQQRNLMWLALAVIPGLVLASGVYSWWRRR